MRPGRRFRRGGQGGGGHLPVGAAACFRAAGTPGAVVLLLVASLAATVSLLSVLPVLRRAGSGRRASWAHGQDASGHHDGLVVPHATASSPPAEVPAPIIGLQRRNTMPPGDWVWSDVRRQQGKRRGPAPATPQTRDGCSGCEANTSGACKHNALPVCFDVNATTGQCPSETTRCGNANDNDAAATSASPRSLPKGRTAAVGADASANKPTFVFVTGSSANHFCPLLNLLRSLDAVVPDVPVIVYDLGKQQGGDRLDREAMARVHRNTLRVVDFDYTAVPSWFDVSVRAGEYAWKPVIVKEVVDEFGSAMWVDSGNLAIAGKLDAAALRRDFIGGGGGFYSPRSQQTPWHWVHPGTFAHFGMQKCCGTNARRPCCCCGSTTAARCDACAGLGRLERANASFWLGKTMCNGALVGFARGTRGYTSVLEPWARCALNRSCIAPLGPGGASHRGNHRQDQAALTMLSHLAGMPCTDRELRAGFRLHQDNRWTNTTFCESVLGGRSRREGLSLGAIKSGTADVVPAASSQDAGPSEGQSDGKEGGTPTGWAPAEERTDLLTKSCLVTAAAQANRNTGTDTVGDGAKITITHVINPFPTSDVHFHWTLPAIVAAYARAQDAGVRVELLAILFEHERVPELPDFAVVLPVLWPNRTAGEHLRRLGVEFDAEERPLRGPIVSDVWDATFRRARGRTVVWTNYDLIVAPEFYVEIAANLAEPEKRLGAAMRGLVGYSALRLDLIIPRDRHPSLEGWTVGDFFAWNRTKPQAGHDTFVFPQRWIPCLDKADVAFGVGGWDHSVFSQMKWLAHLEGAQFRTLSPGRGLPERGMVRHIGSQISNANKVWTNPVSWKGPARLAQYNFNKRQKAAVEIFLRFAFAGGGFCRRRIFGACSEHVGGTPAQGQPVQPPPRGTSLAAAPNNDYRIVGVAVPAPNASAAHRLVEWMTGFRVRSAHLPGLSVSDRNEAVAVVTHATDLFAGPKPADPAVAQDPPKPGKKGRVLRFRAVAVVLDSDPVGSVLALARAAAAWAPDPTRAMTKEALQPHVARYNAFWAFWLGKARGSGVAVEIFNLDANLGGNATTTAATTTTTTTTLEFSILHQFIVYHRCGPSQQAKCHVANQGFGVCCAVARNSAATAAETPDRSNGRSDVAADVVEWIGAETAKTVADAHREWAARRARFPWPRAASSCCG